IFRMVRKTPTDQLMKLQGKLTKKVEQAVKCLAPRDTIFVPSNIAEGPSSSATLLSDRSLPSPSLPVTPLIEMTLRPATELSPLPKYDEVVGNTNEYRASHLKSQDLGVDLIKAALQTEEERIRQLTEDNKMLLEYANTLNFGSNEDDLRKEILALESELSRLRIMYPTLIPPPIPSRPNSTSDTTWICPKCSEREPESSTRCKVCRLPSLSIPLEEAHDCRCKYCAPDNVDSSTDTPGWVVLDGLTIM
ncbi:hypothetical protein PENTCL1PPCAC_3157, partial [Pristionchus entomophagus]